MHRIILLIAACAVSLSCQGDAEKLPPPLPRDGTAPPYSQVLTRLSAQTNAAKEEHFLNHWDALVDASLSLEQSASYVLKSPDLPAIHKAQIEKTAAELNTDILKLRAAARQKDQTESLEMIRRIHTQVRELQDLK